MADVKPLKLVDHGDGAGRLEEFGAADKVPAENLPATEWAAETVAQAEAEAGTAQTRRAWTSQRVWQAIAAWWNGSAAKTQLDAASSGITSLQASKLDATANLTALSGLAGVADRLPYFTGAGALSLTTLTGLARNLLDDTTQSGMQSTLGLVKQTSVTDTTAGALMVVGAFGIGRLYDLRATVLETGTPADVFSRGAVSGFARGGPDGLNIPAITGNNAYGVLSVYGHWQDSSGAAGAASREFLTTTGRKFLQTQTSGSWNQWREVFTTGNILGTVSQTGGVPTGAIIERGSNANGEYVRYADGTQICTNSSFAFTDRTTGNGALFKTADLSWTFPAAFITSPVCVGKPRAGAVADSAWYGLGAGGDGANNTMVFAIHGTTSVAGSGTAMLHAIGRWF